MNKKDKNPLGERVLEAVALLLVAPERVVLCEPTTARQRVFDLSSFLQPSRGVATKVELNEFTGGVPCVSRERFWLDHQGCVDDEIEPLDLFVRIEILRREPFCCDENDLVQEAVVTLHRHGRWAG